MNANAGERSPLCQGPHPTYPTSIRPGAEAARPQSQSLLVVDRAISTRPLKRRIDRQEAFDGHRKKVEEESRGAGFVPAEATGAHEVRSGHSLAGGQKRAFGTATSNRGHKYPTLSG